MILKVKNYYQNRGSVDCGIVSTQMILDYHGSSESFLVLKKELLIKNYGTYSPKIGINLLKRGFNVEIITQQPRLFTLKDQNKTQEKILERFLFLKEKYKSEEDQKVLNYFIEYMNLGGKIKIKIPNQKDIKKSIQRKNPLIAALTSKFLTEEEVKFDFHFHVIKGIDENFIYSNEPSSKRQNPGKYKIEDFIFGIHASTHGDLDNGCLINISK